MAVQRSDSIVIAEGAIVLAQRDKTYRLFKLKKGKKLNFDKVGFYPDGALGCYYGSSFKVDMKQLVLVSDNTEELADKLKGETSSAADNRGVFDDGAAQGLTEEDVVTMKGQGVKGQAIVETIVEHSSSFKEKTKFSQEKYIRKKERKHNPVFRIIRPSTRLLCEMYRDVAPSKICFLREDSLAQMLTMSNVQANSNVIVMETTQGFLTGALLERMGGYGNLVQIFFGDFPVRLILNNFGHLSEQDLSILKMYPIHRIGSLLSPEQQSSSIVLSQTLAELKIDVNGDKVRGDECCVREGSKDGEGVEEKPVNTESERMSMDVEPSEDHDHNQQPACKRPKLADHRLDETGTKTPQRMDKQEKRQKKEDAYREAAELLSQKKMDGLVIASRFHPEPVLMSLVHLLAPSRPIVVYYHILEPLIQCYKNLKESGLAFNIQISESWMRHYQVLEERTHPLMNMSGHSGYLLTATTVNQSL
ncbi:tRNA (adenine(58)-N(1))-methyltransferase non-catalytic subunit TRM6-like isoform X2 [Halichondria panicea]|uniref:tRNA (adenine(58)-N(1))-methyltransferase non-catalytic subunit TRM6-like isoform X2 n=1 Tax=Halichondria panicea TaxID=6063 RepID=UPI00312B4135